MFDNLKKFAAAYAVASGGILRTCLSLWNVRQELQTSHYYLSVHPPAGHVTLVAPTGTRLEVARAYAVTRLGWIRRQQAKLQAQPRETPRQYIERESHYLWGRRCRAGREARGEAGYSQDHAERPRWQNVDDAGRSPVHELPLAPERWNEG